MDAIQKLLRSPPLAPIRRPVQKARKARAAKRSEAAVARLAAVRPDLPALAREVRERKLTYLTLRSLTDLAEVTVDLEQRGVTGKIIEAGTALGGSAMVLGHAKHQDRTLMLFDTFGQIPPPGAKDGEDVHRRYETIARGESQGIDGEVYYGYRDDLVGEVTGNLESVGLDLERDHIELVQGLFQDTMGSLEGPVALAHLDGDWYDSTMVCLQAVGPLIPIGGRIVIDDYGAWSGCRVATDEFLASAAGLRFRKEQRSRLHLVAVR